MARRQTLLVSGLLSSLLYPAIDLLAGLSYEGYSFYSHTISELGAIGAPHQRWLLPLFLTYNLLVVTFAVAVILEGRRSNRRLNIVGWMLLAYIGVGFRNISWMTIAALLSFGALTVPFGMRLAAGQPTPGMGIVERLAYYSILAWVAGLSIALMQRSTAQDRSESPR